MVIRVQDSIKGPLGRKSQNDFGTRALSNTNGLASRHYVLTL